MLLVACWSKEQDSSIDSVSSLETFFNEIENKEFVEGVFTFSEENDANNLLNKPNQYIEVWVFRDSRANNELTDTSNASYLKDTWTSAWWKLEVFENKKDAKARVEYIAEATKDLPAIIKSQNSRDTQIENVVLRLSRNLSNSEQEEYINIANELFWK